MSVGVRSRPSYVQNRVRPSVIVRRDGPLSVAVAVKLAVKT